MGLNWSSQSKHERSHTTTQTLFDDTTRHALANSRIGEVRESFYLWVKDLGLNPASLLLGHFYLFDLSVVKRRQKILTAKRWNKQRLVFLSPPNSNEIIFTFLQLMTHACAVWPDLATFHHFAKSLQVFGQIFDSLFLIWQNAEPTMLNLWYYRAKF